MIGMIEEKMRKIRKNKESLIIFHIMGDAALKTVLRYLGTMQDVIEFIQIRKKYRSAVSQMKYNPVSVTDETIEIFPMLETTFIRKRQV